MIQLKSIFGYITLINVNTISKIVQIDNKKVIVYLNTEEKFEIFNTSIEEIIEQLTNNKQ